MANRYSKVDYRRFASILRSSGQLVLHGEGHWSPEEIIRDIANAIAYEFEKDDGLYLKFDRKQFFALAGINDPKESE